MYLPHTITTHTSTSTQRGSSMYLPHTITTHTSTSTRHLVGLTRGGWGEGGIDGNRMRCGACGADVADSWSRERLTLTHCEFHRLREEGEFKQEMRAFRSVILGFPLLNGGVVLNGHPTCFSILITASPRPGNARHSVQCLHFELPSLSPCQFPRSQIPAEFSTAPAPTNQRARERVGGAKSADSRNLILSP